MKKHFIVFGIIAIFSSIFATSCGDFGDDDSNYPENYEKVAGWYHGQMCVGLPEGDTLIDVDITIDRYLTITPMPMHLLLDSIVDVDRESTLAKQLANTVYYTNYSVSPTEQKDGVYRTMINIPSSPSDFVIYIKNWGHSVRLYHAPVGESFIKTEGGYARLYIYLKTTNAYLDNNKVEKYREIPLKIEGARQIHVGDI